MYSTCRLKSSWFRMRCSQNQRCQISFSPFFNLEADLTDFVGFRSSTQPTLHCLLKQLLISRQRVEKSESPFGNVQIQCRWSGKRTKASILKGYCLMIFLNAWRSNSTLSELLKMFMRPYVTTVKKYVPPSTFALRYRIISLVRFRPFVHEVVSAHTLVGWVEFTKPNKQKLDPSTCWVSLPEIICHNSLNGIGQFEQENNIQHRAQPNLLVNSQLTIHNLQHTTDDCRHFSFRLNISLTNFGLAFPLVIFMTWPTKKPINLVLPFW